MKIEQADLNLTREEKTKIQFGRAMVDKKKLMILDDITGGVNLTTEKLILSLIYSEFKDSTVIITSQKSRTVENCNRVMILNDGKVQSFNNPKILQVQMDNYYANNLILENENLK